MTNETTILSYGQRSASTMPLVVQKRQTQKVSKSIAGSASKAFKDTMVKELKKQRA